MKAKRIITIIAITALTISLFTGCGISNMNRIYNDNSKIADMADTFGLDESEEMIEEGSYKGKFKLNGSGTIWRYESDEDFDLEVPYNLSVKSGKAKIVLISPDNTVTTLIENTDKATIDGNTTLSIPVRKGINRIKVVGYKKSDIDIELHIKKGTFEKISF